MRYLQEMGERLRQAPDEQISLTDPDARSMATSGRSTGMVGYNVQIAVDAEHHLIVAHDVVNLGHDRTQLASMATQAKAAVDEETLEVLADRGYYKGPEILACEQSGITPFVPMTMTSDNKARGLFDKRDFVYQADQNVYRCPTGQLLPRHHQSVEQGLVIHTYYNLSACMQCPIKARAQPRKGSAESDAGSMRPYWSPCSVAWMPAPARCDGGAARLSMCSGR